MTKVKTITSFSNETIKYIHSLKHKKYSKQHASFMAEGFEYIAKALAKNWQIEYLLYNKSLGAEDRLVKIIKQSIDQNAQIIVTSLAILQKLSGKENSPPIIAVFKTKQYSLNELTLEEHENYIALEDIKDGSNLGAIFRICAAFAAPSVILIGNHVYPFAIEAIRASAGSVFDVNIYSGTKKEFLTLAQGKANLIGTDLSARISFQSINYKKSTNIIIMGNEQTGLSPELAQKCTVLTKIPQSDEVNSLNLSVATALVLFEAQEHKLKLI